MKKCIVFSILLTASLYGVAQAPANKPAAKPAAKPAQTAAPKPGEARPPVLNTALDSFSYAMGMMDATFFKSQGVTEINYVLMNKGFDDVLKGKMTLLDQQQADMTIRDQLQAFLRKKSQATIDAGEKFLAENKKRAGVQETPSGLQYEVITMGTGPKPADTSRVQVHYEGTLIDGTKFDSSRDRGEPIAFGLNQVIRGWTEGLQLMPVGSRFKLYIPYTLGYGEQGAGGSIPGGAALIFDVELLGIE
ncbi:MAG: FKBP-type peptidyl-prolyl cis-trans isomerase [Chitinophagaceae bacterium]|nr:FKBP-type peptidyl-prolyl cis-trans isomerase [Chitinophagaceae bacterium]MCW5927131.1 FKBP-type peptidyl-prolyl cis-trans isomerase [Chitinophagaceae bacterium]